MDKNINRVSCEFCAFPAKNLMTVEEDDDEGNIVILEIIGNFLRMFDSKLPGFTEIQKINYCPMCGRKLEEMRTPKTVILRRETISERG